jgi:hypothetical protein
MTRTGLAIGVSSTVVIYVWVVVIQGDSSAKHEIAVGGLFALLVSFAIGSYSAQIVARRITRLEEAARKIADGRHLRPARQARPHVQRNAAPPGRARRRPQTVRRQRVA